MCFLFSLPLFALSTTEVKTAEFQLNKGAGLAANQLGSLVTTQKVWVLKGTYDYDVMKSVSGGTATGTISLRSPTKTSLRIPKNAIVTGCVIDVVTQPTSSAGTATMAFGTGQAGNDLKTATDVTALSAALYACVPDETVANSIKMTADRTPSITLISGTITAGKIHVLIKYILSDL